MSVSTIPARTNAPGHCPAEGAQKANDCKESRAVTSIPEPVHADTRQGRQMKAALAIAKMCEHQLPDISHWLIAPDCGVRGMIAATYADRLGALTRWAAYLAATEDKPQPVIVREKGSKLSRVSVYATRSGVAVEIWFSALPSEVADIRKHGAGS